MTAAKSSFQTILVTAETLIRDKGCRKTTLQDIIRQSGLSKGAIYHYVSSKDELLGLVMKSRIEQINSRFTEAVNSPNTRGLEEPLQLIAEGMVRSTSQEDVTNKIFLYLLSQMDIPAVAETIREVYEYTMNICKGWIEAGQRSGVIPVEADKERIAEMLVTFMYGLRVQNTIRQEARGMSAEQLILFLRKALQE
jgi:AcrR family transcriptional regulator